MLKKTPRPQVSAYECMLLICSSLVKRGKTILRQNELVKELYKYKNNPETAILFKDVAFKENWDTITSIDIANSLSTLQTFGAIGKLNPAYEKIILYITPDEAERFIQRFEDAYVQAADVVSKGIFV